MQASSSIAALALFVFLAPAVAQVPNQPKLTIDANSHLITVGAEDKVSVDPDLAILQIGFESKIGDAKSVYAEGAKTSNAIVAALKQANLEDAAIRSESQRLEPVDAKNHKFKLEQSWSVKCPPDRVAEILDAAVTAGATDSGDIDWTVKDVRALENEALEKATARARSDTEVMAKASGAKLGALVYLTDQMSGSSPMPLEARNFASFSDGLAKSAQAMAPPMAIAPNKVIRTASVYAVFAIE